MTLRGTSSLISGTCSNFRLIGKTIKSWLSPKFLSKPGDTHLRYRVLKISGHPRCNGRYFSNYYSIIIFSMSLMRNRSSTARTFSPLKQLCGDEALPLAEHLTYLELNQMDKIHPSEIVEVVMARERGKLPHHYHHLYHKFL